MYYLCYKEAFQDPPPPVPPTTAYVCVLHPGAGFFSIFFFICKVYLYAKENNCPFFIEHDKWQYTHSQGWHDYFKTLTYFKDEGQFSVIKRYVPHVGPDLPEYTVQQYIDCTKELFILTDDLQQRVDEYRNSLGNYTSLYVRWGDKINETALVSLDEILPQTDIKDDGRTIFVQTDDYSVIIEMKNRYPSCRIMTLTPDTQKGANNSKMSSWDSQKIKSETEELLISSCIFVQAQKGWTYYHSNVGAFHKLFGYSTVDFYVDKKHSKESVNEVYQLDHKGSPYLMVAYMR
jgi:hypothetical protein